MKDVASTYKPYQLIVPQLATATVTGSAVQITPGEEADAVAIINLGALTSNGSVTLIVTISASLTSGGSYTTIATSATAACAAAQIGSLRVKINTGIYAFVKATATFVFTSGTTPNVPIAVSLLVQETVASDANNILAIV